MKKVQRGKKTWLSVATLVSVVALVMTACSSGSNSAKSSPPSTATSGSSTPGSSVGPSSSPISDLFPVNGPSHGKSYKIGLSISLTGGLTFGHDGLNGIKLAQQEIAAAGGPNFDLVTQDVGIDPTKGVTTARSFASSGIDIQVTSASAVLGSQLPIIAQDHILSFDPSAGVGVYPDKPFFWAAKGETPNGPWPTMVKYIEHALPNAKRVVFSTSGTGAISSTQENQLKADLKGTQLSVVGTVLYPQTTTSFANVASQINADHPDVVVLAAYATQPAQFMKDYVAAGGKAQVISADFTTQDAQVGGSALNNLWFAQDNFLPDHPTNAWQTYFDQQYVKAYGSQPSIYSATYYNALFLIWQLIDKALSSGVDVSNGTAMQSLLESNPGPYTSVIGVGTKSGEMAFDTQDHSLGKQYSYMIGKVENEQPVPLAYGNADGTGFKLVGS